MLNIAEPYNPKPRQRRECKKPNFLRKVKRTSDTPYVIRINSHENIPFEKIMRLRPKISIMYLVFHAFFEVRVSGRTLSIRHMDKPFEQNKTYTFNPKP